MSDLVSKKNSLVGQVVEDLSYEGLSPQRFAVELREINALPQYKEGGFFVFSNLRDGTYRLRVAGQGFQAQEYALTLPLASVFFNQPGDNEISLVVKTVNGAKITFDEIILTRDIKKDSPVLAEGLATALAAPLEAGRVIEAKLAETAGLAPGAIVRIVRGPGIRLRFGPYFRFPSEPTRLVGNVAHATAANYPLAGAAVRITQVNGVNVAAQAVAGLDLFTVEIAGKTEILGPERDITTLANDRGDYNFYFSKADFFEEVTLTATLAGYQAKTLSAAIHPGERKKIDFKLATL